MFFRKRKHMLALQEYGFCNGWYREKMNVKTLNKIKNLHMEISVINADTEEQENEKPGMLTAWLFPSYTDVTDPSSRALQTRSNVQCPNGSTSVITEAMWVMGEEGDSVQVAMRRKGTYSHEPVTKQSRREDGTPGHHLGRGRGLPRLIPPALWMTPEGWAALPVDASLGGSRHHLGEKQY